ncbi:hypothetical protein NEUTE1DRAFT_106761 [Neurospora tetrasperma FGSC 2508]|uniref:Uncharacterized protein n=1 Tax=Neurospora tetrasperma (strain FGSC 2508 / ATCC MYA-4615 / P0657) TaxID=510951 RepID=F8MAI0_NEUT8|nr:uncharacterized protein NEUTE1DRAFT_106761 [Neurospora tetrasperma FGSC 2508]EGO60101.1 hypothetical protein NEUTE1DRAFT_106761 [Neurospora tetrasperma FGSC 2508]EGZ75949.1 hypothetical protein NEUTE2DRAFT_56298 [Neurospora tetrasperma FGSC 2509]
MEQYQQNNPGEDMVQREQIVAIAKFVHFLQDNFAYPGSSDKDVKMSEALKRLAVKYKEHVEDNRLGWFGNGDDLGGLFSEYFSSSILKLIRELPAPNIQDEAEHEARALGGQIVYPQAVQARPAEQGGQIVYCQANETTTASSHVMGHYCIQVVENGVVSALNLHGDGPVTITVVVQKRGNPIPNPNYNPNVAIQNGLA